MGIELGTTTGLVKGDTGGLDNGSSSLFEMHVRMMKDPARPLCNSP